MAIAQQAKPEIEIQQEAEKKAKKVVRPVGDIQSDMDETRARLAGNIEQLKAEASPKALGQKAKAKATSSVTYPDGTVKTERVLMIAGGVVALLLLRKGLKARAQRKELQRLAEIVWVPVPRNSVNPELAAVSRNAKELAPLTQYQPQLELASA